jgi:hypothetical protein
LHNHRAVACAKAQAQMDEAVEGGASQAIEQRRRMCGNQLPHIAPADVLQLSRVILDQLLEPSPLTAQRFGVCGRRAASCLHAFAGRLPGEQAL